VNESVLLEQIASAVPDWRAIGFIDATLGSLVASRARSESDGRALELAASAAMELFPAAGEDANTGEIVVVSPATIHYLRRSRDGTGLVFAAICGRSLNLGALLVRLRSFHLGVGRAA
jgi:hypothetical protein